MCGIFGFVGSREASPLIIDGLRKLEYRGYDSAGLATIQNSDNDQFGKLITRKSKGKLINLSNLMFVQKGEISRIGYKILDDGTKVRISLKTGQEIQV